MKLQLHWLGALACALFLRVGCPAGAAAPPFDLSAEVARALKAGGGEVVIPPGEHLLPTGLRLKDVKNLQLVGFDRDACVLKLPPVAYCVAAENVAAGATSIRVDRLQLIKPGMLLHIDADGEVEPFTKKPKPFLNAKVKAVESANLILAEPLKFPVPAGAMIRDENGPNLIEINGACENIQLRKLTLDGGREDTGPYIRGHAQLCGVLVSGRYSYEKGRLGPQPKQIAIQDCIIRNCYGRGIAFYSAASSSVERCTIMDTSDEAVDLDHFTKDCVVSENYIARSLVGIELNDASNCRVESNEVRACVTGINLWRWCKQPGLNEGHEIRRNLFEDMSGNGIQIGRDTARNRIVGNEIVRPGRNGVSLYGKEQTLDGNDIQGAKLKPIAIGEGEGTHIIK